MMERVRGLPAKLQVKGKMNGLRKFVSASAALMLALVMGCASGMASSGAGAGTTAPPIVTSAGNQSYYVDCSQASNGNGTKASPWNSLVAVNAKSYAPGDVIYFKSGTTCNGMFSPGGSGSASSPITVTDYGTGALPVMDGGSANNSAIALTNQSYWTLENLDVTHGVKWGILAQATGGNNVSGLTIKNVTATGATSVSTVRAKSGEIGLLTDGTSTSTISDVKIANVTVGDTKAGEGIFIKAGQQGAYYGPKGQNISVTHSKIDNVYGDGLLVTNAEHVTLSHDVVTKSGECPNCTGSTPGALWVWNSVDVDISWNESYDNTSWKGDGGGIDIDFLNRNVTVEDNYIHDNKGYCVSVFGAGHQTTVNSVIRFNVCVNNDAGSTIVNKGDFLLSTWNGGSLNGVQIYDNTSYWTAPPADDYELADNNATFTGSEPDFFENNIVYTPLSTPYLVEAAKPMTANHNLYYGPNATEYGFEYDGTAYTSLAQYQKASGQGLHSVIGDPLLPQPGYDVTGVWPTTQITPQAGSPAIGAGVNVCAGISGCSMGTSDFLGNPLPAGNFWIGAAE